MRNIDKILFRRGLKKNLPHLDLSEIAFVTDENRLYLGTQEGNTGLANVTDITDKYSKPLNGVPESDLSSDTREKLNVVQDNGMLKKMNQIDYVQILERHLTITKKLFKKVNANKFEVILYNNGRHLTYEFYKNIDDMIIQSRVTGGEYTLGKGFINSENSSSSNISSSVIPPSNGVHGYVTSTGATITTVLKVEKDNTDIHLNLYRRYDGGLWEYTLDDSAPVLVSCYSDSSITETKMIYSGLKSGTYLLKGTFKGNVDGVNLEKPRGWIVKTNTPYIYFSRETVIPVESIIYTEQSNKEFAYSFKPVDGGENYNFFPYHGVSTAFKVEDARFLDGDKEIKASAMNEGQIIEIEDFSLTQHLNARHPDTPDKNSIDLWCKHNISKVGMLSIDGKMTCLEDIYFNNSYAIMGTARGDVFDYLMTSFGNKYEGTSENLGLNIPMTEERDWAKSFLFLSNKNKDVAIAYRYNNAHETLREGQFGKDALVKNMTYLQNRNEVVKKVYSRLFNSSKVPKGYSHKFSGDYIFVKSTGVSNYF